MSSFQDLEVFRAVFLRQKHKERSRPRILQRERDCSTLTTHNFFGLLPQGYCEPTTSKS